MKNKTKTSGISFFDILATKHTKYITQCRKQQYIISAQDIKIFAKPFTKSSDGNLIGEFISPWNQSTSGRDGYTTSENKNETQQQTSQIHKNGKKFHRLSTTEHSLKHPVHMETVNKQKLREQTAVSYTQAQYTGWPKKVSHFQIIKKSY